MDYEKNQTSVKFVYKNPGISMQIIFLSSALEEIILIVSNKKPKLSMWELNDSC